MFPSLLPVGLQGSPAQELGASSGMCSDPNPKPSGSHEGLNCGFLSQAVQTEMSQVGPSLENDTFGKMLFLKTFSQPYKFP